MTNEILIETDEIRKHEWAEQLSQFEDATIYQTWSYGTTRWGERNLSHSAFTLNGKVVAMAQLRIVSVPLFGAMVAYLGNGPVWRLRGGDISPQVLEDVIKLLQYEYVNRRGLYLRVVPYDFEGSSTAHLLCSTLEHARFKRSAQCIRTILLDLTLSLEDLRKGQRRTWRQTLGYSEKRGLEVRLGKGSDLLKVAIALYKEMRTYKSFVEFVNMEQLESIQEELPETHKITTMVCYYENTPTAALAWTQIGDTGIPVLAATGVAGLRLNSSYYLWWTMVEMLKGNRCRWLDLGGINPDRNPGGYTFKSGLAGKQGWETYQIGQFDASIPSVNALLVKSADYVRTAFRAAKVKAEKIRVPSLNHVSRGAGIIGNIYV